MSRLATPQGLNNISIYSIYCEFLDIFRRLPGPERRDVWVFLTMHTINYHVHSETAGVIPTYKIIQFSKKYIKGQRIYSHEI